MNSSKSFLAANYVKFFALRFVEYFTTLNGGICSDDIAGRFDEIYARSMLNVTISIFAHFKH